MADLIEAPAGGDVLVFQATGNTSAPFASSGSDVNIPSPPSLYVIDANGDGVLDLAYSDTAGNWHYRLGNARVTDLVDTITDGFGLSTAITYAPLTDGSVYHKGSGSAFPTQDIDGPEYVVKQTSSSDGLGGTYLQTYLYTAARVNLQGRGSLGFGSVSVQDGRNSTTRTVTYRQDAPYAGTVWEDDLFQPDGSTFISKTTNTPAYMTLAGTDCALITQPDATRRCFAYVHEAVTTHYEVSGNKRGSAISKDDTTYTYDSYGTVSHTTAVTTDLDATTPVSPFNGLTWTTVIDNSITNDASANWCLGRPTLTTTTKTVPNEPTLTRHVKHVIDYSNCRATQEVLEPQENAAQPADQKLQVTTTYEYSPEGCGNPTKATIVGLDQNGAAMTGRVTQTGWGTRCTYAESITNAVLQGASTTYDYNLGVPLNAYDVDNLKTSWTYDEFGRKLTETHPDNTSSNWTYSDCTASSCWGTADLRFLVKETTIDSSGRTFRTTQKYYDGLDRLRFQEGNRELGVWTNASTAYDNLGRKTQEWLPYSLSSNGYHTYGYDIANRLTTDTLYDSGGSVYRSILLTYNGATGAVQDPNNNVTMKVTDVTGKLRRVIAPSSTVNCPKGYSQCGTTSYDYDAFGNLVTLTDATGVVSTYGYNLRGFKTSTTDADTGSWQFTPNSLNELITEHDAKGNTTTLGYDALGRVTSRLEPESTTAIIFTYGTDVSIHERGRLVSVTKPDGYTEAYTFDAAGRDLNVKYTEDGTTYQFDYGYNALGALDTLTYPVSTGGARFALKSVYDSSGYLNQVQDASTGAAFWTLNNSNDSAQPTSETLGNTILVASGYTPWTNELVSRSEGTGGSTTNRQNLSYTWDKAGNLQNRQDLNQHLTEVFTVDALNRLSTVTLNGTPTLSVTYDSAGNIQTKSDVGSYTYGDPRHPHAVTAAGSWTIGYDANGNMSSRAGGAISSYSYNLPQLVNYNGNTDQFFYNSSHQRWKQVANYTGSIETTHYIGGLLEVLQRGTNTEYRHLIKAGSNSVVYTRRTDGTNLTNSTYYLTSDHLGSANLVLDSSGNTLASESFTPFGARRGSNWQGVPTTADYSTFASTSRRGFTGHEMLDSVSLVHMNGRVYDPFLGRFLSPDVYIQALGASESINPYSYAWNDPLRYVDPSGHSLLGFVGAIVGIAIAIFAPEAISFIAGSAETFSATTLAVIGGFAGGFIGTYISTGNLSASLTAGLIGGVTGGLFAQIGEAAEAENWTAGERVFGHAFVGCFTGVVSSGNCGSGAVSAALSEAAIDYHILKPDSVGVWGSFKGAAEVGVIGGVSSRLSGGSFKDGFSVSAAGYLFNETHNWLGKMFVGTDAHLTLLAHLEGRPPDAGMWSGNIWFGSNGRPDLLYGPEEDNSYYGWEIKPIGQNAAAADQLQDYIDGANGKLTAGNNAIVFRDETSIRLRGTWFPNTFYTYTPGQAGVVMYSTEEDIAERVQVFFYKQRKNNQPWRGVNVPATEGATETALEGLLE
jgi:RHS repeat-associated protein